MELFLLVQQARPYSCPELEPSVWAPSDQPGKAFPPWELGRAEPWFLGLRSPKGRVGPGSPPAVVLPCECLDSAIPGELWTAGFGSTQESARGVRHE